MSSPPNYPNAYCVKCGTHTETSHKHTVVLANQSRALRGVCPTCGTENYKILPAKVAPAEAPEARSPYPDAFCVKCKEHTPTLGARTIILENQSRALMGSCACCGSEVYRILAAKNAAEAGAKFEEKKAAPLAQNSSPFDAGGKGDRPSLELVAKNSAATSQSGAGEKGTARPTKLRRHEPARQAAASTSAHAKPDAHMVQGFKGALNAVPQGRPMSSATLLRYGKNTNAAAAAEVPVRMTRRAPATLVPAHAQYLFAGCVILAICGVVFAAAMLV